jgi:hypothetical protein
MVDLEEEVVPVMVLVVLVEEVIQVVVLVVLVENQGRGKRAVAVVPTV